MVEDLGEKGPVGKALKKGLRKRRKADQGTRRRGVIHPSELSSCARKAQYTYMSTDDSPPKVPPKENDLKIFQLGHWLHDVVQGVLEEVWPHGVTEVEAFHAEYLFYGHCDYLVPRTRAVEIKTCSNNVLKQLKMPRESHIKQCSIYAAILGAPLCNVFYISRESGQFKEFEFPTDMAAWVEMCSQAADIINATAKDQLVSGTYSYMVCKSCGYRDACELWEYRV